MHESEMQDEIRRLDWECLDSDTRYLTHGIHRYSGKFIPQIARQAIALVSEPGELILDPYCGSGTTLLESTLANRTSVGIDLNPLAVLISKAKTTVIPQDRLRASITFLEEALSAVQRQTKLTAFGTRGARGNGFIEAVKNDPRWDDGWYRKWFADDILFELVAISQALQRLKDPMCRRLGLVALSDILRKSSNAHSSYPNVMYDKNHGMPLPAVPRFLERLRKIEEAVQELEMALKGRPLPLVVRSDAGKLPLRSDSVDAVVTHPPYICSIPYAEYGSLSLKWLGNDPRQLERQLTGGLRQSKTVVSRFEQGFGEMLSEVARVLKPLRYCFVLVGNPLVRGQRIDLTEMTIRRAEERGLRLVATHERRGTNRRANLMEKETIILLKKS